jgi:S-DNA-T family DNA segregation ATPase FtsK/SpoIIIE
VVATAAPVVVSLGIWAVTGSPYSLLFAALGPVVALGSLLDGRRQRRQTVRVQTERTVAALERTRDRLRELQEQERERLRRSAPAIDTRVEAGRVASAWSSPADLSAPDAAPLPVRLGRADGPPVVVVDGTAGELESDGELPPSVRAALNEVHATAAVFPDAPVLADAVDGIGIVGPSAIARALARAVVLQLAATRSPVTTSVAAPPDEAWVRALPHATTIGTGTEYRVIDDGVELRVAWAGLAAGLPAGIPGISLPPQARLEPLGSARAAATARRLADVADERGLAAADRRLPLVVGLAEVLAADVPADESGRTDGSAAGAGLRAPVGRGPNGVVELDLVRDGPHAVVAGTTGTGKSELLVSWVLAMASRHPPSIVTFLLVDFKGGAAFAALAGLPHVLGTVSDLDARRSARAIESLRAELLRREQVLAERGARSIDEVAVDDARRPGEPHPSLARLVIVVDEFAAVVSGQPELHELFADLAARGRSLGLHLVLCTQRPSGVVRDAVLANIALRISLRVTDRGDSVAMLGSDAAARLAPEPRGRALIADGSGGIREVQWALAERGDAAKLADSGIPPAAAVWREPLPEVLPLAPLLTEPRGTGGLELPRGDSGRRSIPFGRLDLPAEQRQPIACYDPRDDGHLLVLGAARSGRTTALATLAQAARSVGVPVTVVPGDPAEAWSVLAERLDRGSQPVTAGGLLLLDDLDQLIERVDPDSRHELLELLTRLARGSRGVGLVVSAQRLTGGLASFAGLFDSRVLLRQPSREEHVLSGGEGAAFDPRLPPGSGRWMGIRGAGATIQLALGSEPLPVPELVELPVVAAEPGRALAVAAPRPRELARRWAASGARVVLLGEQTPPGDDELLVSRGGAPIVLLGDPDAWQAEWALLGLARRDLPLAVVGCTASELRAMVRARDAAPPLGSRAGECWRVEAGAVSRALLQVPGPPA